MDSAVPATSIFCPRCQQDIAKFVPGAGAGIFEDSEQREIRAQRRKLWCDVVASIPGSSMSMAIIDADRAVREFDDRFMPKPVVVSGEAP